MLELLGNDGSLMLLGGIGLIVTGLAIARDTVTRFRNTTPAVR